MLVRSPLQRRPYPAALSLKVSPTNRWNLSEVSVWESVESFDRFFYYSRKKNSKVIKKGAKWLRRPLLIIGHAAAYIFRKNLCSTCPMAAPCVTGSQVGAVSYCFKDCLRRSWEAIMSFWIWKNPPSQWHTALSKSTLLRVLAPWPWECKN
jgi:hypothetical protein